MGSGGQLEATTLRDEALTALVEEKGLGGPRRLQSFRPWSTTP